MIRTCAVVSEQVLGNRAPQHERLLHDQTLIRQVRADWDGRINSVQKCILHQPDLGLNLILSGVALVDPGGAGASS